MKPSKGYSLFMLVFLSVWLSIAAFLPMWPSYVPTGLSRCDWVTSTLWEVILGLPDEAIYTPRVRWEAHLATVIVFGLVWILGYGAGHSWHQDLTHRR